MNTNKFNLVAAVVAGFVGALVFTRLFDVTPAYAKTVKSHPTEVRAERFILVGEDGSEKGRLSVIPNHGPALILEDGESAIRLGVLGKAIPSLSFSSESKTSVDIKGVGGIGLMNLKGGNGQEQVSIMGGSKDGPRISLHGRAGEIISQVPAAH